MTTLVHAVLTFRKTVRNWTGLLLTMSFLVVCALGVFSVRVSQLGLEHVLISGLWLAFFARRAALRFSAEDKGFLTPWHDLEMGLLLLAFIYSVVQLGGGLTGQLYPLVYVLVAFVASFAQKPMGTVLVIVAVVFEALLYFVTEQQSATRAVLLARHLHRLLRADEPALHARRDRARARDARRRKLDEDKLKALEDARRYRLIERAARRRGARRRAAHALQRRRGAPGALLHARPAQAHARAAHLRADDVRRAERALPHRGARPPAATTSRTGPFKDGEGAVGAVMKRGMTMNLEHIKPGYRGLCYYRGPARVRAFLGVPVIESGKVLGALCGDRMRGPPVRGARRGRARGRGPAHPARHRERARVRAARAHQERADRAAPGLAGAGRSADRRRRDRGRPQGRRRRSHRTTSRPSRATTPSRSATRCGAPWARAPRSSRTSASATTPRSPRWPSRTATTCPTAASSMVRSRWSTRAPRACAACSRC